MWKVISFYTEKYKKEANRLIRSLKKYGIEYDIEFYNSSDKWVTNTNYKQKFIKNKLIEHKHSLVWLDADSKVIKYPYYFDIIKEDIGIHLKDFDKMQTGTMYFKYNKRVISLLEMCEKKAKCNPRVCDGPNIHDAVKSRYLSGKINVFFLPPQYCYIFDLFSHWKNPVIKHYQASRKYR